MLYAVIYGPRNLEGRLQLAARNNLRLNMQKLLEEGFVEALD